MRIPRHLRRFWRSSRPGLAPGTLHAAGPEDEPARIEIHGIAPDGVESACLTGLDALDAWVERWPMIWMNVTGLADRTLIEAIGRRFGVHHLVLEDIVNVHQRPKFEPYDELAYLATRMPLEAIESRKGEAVETTDTEQVSILLGENIVITFQEHAGDCFDEVRRRLSAGRKLIRTMGPAYLTYALLDAVVDSYFPVIEGVAERIEAIEQRLMTDHPGDTMTEVYEVRQDLASLRRLVWAQRSMLESLIRDDRFRDETALHLRDVLDHVNLQYDLIDTYRDLAAGVFDLWTSKASIRTGEITRVLTVFASIFIPITFVASVYGMNFTVLPGSGSPAGFWVLMGLMAMAALVLLWFFRRKGWLTGIPSSVETDTSRPKEIDRASRGPEERR